jgi:hypothetical protein
MQIPIGQRLLDSLIYRKIGDRAPGQGRKKGGLGEGMARERGMLTMMDQKRRIKIMHRSQGRESVLSAI